MQQYTRYFLSVLLLGAVLIPLGCSGGSDHSAARELLDAAEAANRRFRKASAILANPSLQDGELRAAAEKSEVLPLLAEAVTKLNTALAKYSDTQAEPGSARAEATVTAKRVLAEVQQLKANFMNRKMLSAMDRARAAARQANHVLEDLQSQELVVARLEKLSQVGQEDIFEVRSSMQQELQAAQAEVDELQKGIDQRKDEQTKLEEQIKQQTIEESKLMAEASQMSSKENLKTLDKALAMRDKIQAASNQVQQKQNQIEHMQMQLSKAEVRLAAAQSVMGVLEEIQGERTEMVQTMTSALDKAKQELASMSKTLSQALNDAVAHSISAKDLGNEAIAVLQEAEKAAGESAQLADKKDKALSYSTQAMINSDLASMRIMIWQVGKMIESLATRVNSVWETLGPSAPAAPATTEMTTFVENTAGMAEAAAQAQTAAVTAFEKAVNNVDTSIRWGYQMSLATAYHFQAGLYDMLDNLDGATQARSNARDLLDKLQSYVPKDKTYLVEDLRVSLFGTASGV